MNRSIIHRDSATRRSKWLRVCWWMLVILVCVMTVFSCYGGLINPDVTTIGALMAMAMPGFVTLLILTGIVSFWVDRWSIVACVVTLLCCAAPVLEYAPLNIPKPMPSAEQLRDSSFTFLEYNALHFSKYDQDYGNDTINRTVSYILGQDPDVACIPELETLRANPNIRLTQLQVDSLLDRYPYHCIDTAGNSVLSKFPIRPIRLTVPDSFNGHLTAYRMYVHDVKFTLFVVHMTSIGLSSDDKELFKALTELNAISEFEKVRHQLIGKLSVAYRYRAQQARILRDYIDRLGEGNVIVAGDFNDIPGCYALRTIMGDDFKSVYSEVGRGPAITYYGNRFYFRIDHILYRGDLRPLWVRIDYEKLSDHYPMMTQFLITNQ